MFYGYSACVLLEMDLVKEYIRGVLARMRRALETDQRLPITISPVDQDIGGVHLRLTDFGIASVGDVTRVAVDSATPASWRDGSSPEAANHRMRIEFSEFELRFEPEIHARIGTMELGRLSSIQCDLVVDAEARTEPNRDGGFDIDPEPEEVEFVDAIVDPPAGWTRALMDAVKRQVAEAIGAHLGIPITGFVALLQPLLEADEQVGVETFLLPPDTDTLGLGHLGIALKPRPPGVFSMTTAELMGVHAEREALEREVRRFVRRGRQVTVLAASDVLSAMIEESLRESFLHFSTEVPDERPPFDFGWEPTGERPAHGVSIWPPTGRSGTARIQGWPTSGRGGKYATVTNVTMSPFGSLEGRAHESFMTSDDGSFAAEVRADARDVLEFEGIGVYEMAAGALMVTLPSFRLADGAVTVRLWGATGEPGGPRFLRLELELDLLLGLDPRTGAFRVEPGGSYRFGDDDDLHRVFSDRALAESFLAEVIPMVNAELGAIPPGLIEDEGLCLFTEEMEVRREGVVIWSTAVAGDIDSERSGRGAAALSPLVAGEPPRPPPPPGSPGPRWDELRVELQDERPRAIPGSSEAVAGELIVGRFGIPVAVVRSDPTTAGVMPGVTPARATFLATMRAGSPSVFVEVSSEPARSAELMDYTASIAATDVGFPAVFEGIAVENVLLLDSIVHIVDLGFQVGGIRLDESDLEGRVFAVRLPWEEYLVLGTELVPDGRGVQPTARWVAWREPVVPTLRILGDWCKDNRADPSVGADHYFCDCTVEVSGGLCSIFVDAPSIRAHFQSGSERRPALGAPGIAVWPRSYAGRGGPYRAEDIGFILEVRTREHA